MESLEALRRRLETAGSLHSVVRTMKALASVSIHQYEEATRSLRTYARTVELGFQVALRGRRSVAALTETASPHLGAVVFGSAHGLAGRFNGQVARLAAGRIAQLAPDRLTLLALGPYVAEHLAAAGRAPDRTLALPGSVGAFAAAVQELVVEVETWRRDLGVDRVLLFYNLHTTGARFTPHTQRLLPLDAEWLAELAERPWGGPSLPTHRIGIERLFRALVREHLFVVCYQAYAESLASENASRLAAMQAAERNIEERIDELTQLYHRRRQSSITEELLDLTAGFEALAGEEPGV
jgi:F-type H+-transporting ATPase subunit gamma